MMMEPTHRVLRDTSCYVTGPLQGRPPEGMFTAGEMVCSLGYRQGGYLRVRSEDGEREGYVFEHAMEPLEAAMAGPPSSWAAALH